MLPGTPSTSRTAPRLVCAVLIGAWILNVPPVHGQTLEESVRELGRQVAQMNVLIGELQAEIVSSRAENRELRLELRRLLEPGAAPVGRALALTELQIPVVGDPVPVVSGQTTPAADLNLPVEERVAQLEEGQQLLADRLEEQYQTKVESASRYRTRLSGIVLLNGFINRGNVDSLEVPNVALPNGPEGVPGRPAFSALQSQLGFETYGPTLAGARASAGLQFDFFGINQGTPYSSSWGGVRLRTAVARLDWARTSVVVGQDSPFLSPLSPTSVASLAYPAFARSGNLWNWIPQARVEHRFEASERSTITVQGGFMGPIRGGTPQPGYATRLAWAHGETDRGLTLGVGAYYTSEDRGFDRTQNGWAGTLDWLVPLGDRLSFSGEFYRGRGIGGLGASQGRSVVFDGPESDPLSTMVGLHVIGGWSQLTFRPLATIELNAGHGEDQSRSRDLRFSGGYGGSMISKNRSEMVNMIYRPRTDLVFSLEYRHLRTWRHDASSESAGHVNLGVGVLF